MLRRSRPSGTIAVSMHRPRDGRAASTTPAAPAARASLLSLLTASILLLLLPSSVVPPFANAEEFNFEVGQRVRERLVDYMDDPATVARLIVEYRINGGFAHGMDAPDRDDYLKLNDATMTLFPHFESIYYGLEDGVFVGHGFATRIGNYREPGESGYDVTDASMQKHYKSCVGKDGSQQNCDMVPGNSYIECTGSSSDSDGGGCVLDKCPDDDSQRDCSALASDEERRVSCEEKVRWCKQYAKKEAPPAEEEGGEEVRRRLGFVPRMTACIDGTGVLSQKSGTIVKKDTDTLGNCYYLDGVTFVNRTLAGEYAFCGGGGAICDGTFAGAYIHRDYDPRWRGWYEATKAKQRSNWSPPYPFFSNLEMGITYAEPIYSVEFDKNVFKGVVAVDYTFENITQFLIDNYLDTSTAVAVFEEAEPNYMIGSSTGSKAAKKVLRADKTQPCPDVNSDECTATRLTISELSDRPMDVVLAKAFAKQKEAGFPAVDLVSVKADGSVSSSSAIYVSHTQLFELPDAQLKWRIIIISPTALSSSDTILRGDSLFGFIVAIGALGFVLCLVLFYMFFQKRKSRAIIASDWRFTSAFIWGCTLLNTATFSFLGPNTDALCMLRMWLFHFFFALALSPLLVKTYRMMKLVGGRRHQRVTISHAKAAMYTLPIILTQIIILTVFSVVDPSKETEIVEMNSASDASHRIICSHNTNAFFIVELVFEGGLVLLGCVLAFKTRNLKGDFGEAKQLVFTMYDVAVVGTVVVVVSFVMGSDQAGKRLLQAIGIFWITVFSCCVFVLPRLIQTKQDNASNSRHHALQVSGLNVLSEKSEEKTSVVAASHSNTI